MIFIQYVDNKSNIKEVDVNISENCLEKYIDGVWNFGLINDNKNIFNDKKLKNKENVILSDGTRKYGHIIHLVRSKGYFFITNNNFWNKFNNEN